MGLLHPKLLLLLSHLAFLLVSSSAQLPPAPAPSYHHHHHHHPHHKPHPHPVPAYAPAKPPTKLPAYPPVKPPIHPPVKPPVHPPVVVKPPTKPPVVVKPPVHPPVKPPVHPPVVVKPPTKPPVVVKPPVKPPAKPPTYPPVKPPAHPPVKPPTKPPTLPPVKPPVHPPVKPPTTPPVKPPTPYIPLPKKPVAVQGVVYCKNCSYSGVDTLLGSSPLSGATVVLKCRTLKSVVMKNATTDKNGYFFMEAPKGVTSYNVTKYCHVYLGAAPAGAKCRRPTNLNGGSLGGLLKPNPLAPSVPYTVYNVGPFAFEPPKRRCHKPASDEDVVQPQFAHY